MRSGNTGVDDGRLRLLGVSGYSWSSIAATKAWGNPGIGAYSLGFSNNGAAPSGGPAYRYYGFPLR